MRTATGVIAVLLLAAPQAFAADEALKKALNDYGAAAGKIEASVPFCGGPPEEAESFAIRARKRAEEYGAGPLEWAVIRAAMQKAKEAASLTNRDCTDTGGRELATELLTAQRALQAALN